MLPTSALVLSADGAVEGVLREAGGPGLVEPLFEGAALVGPVLVVVAGGDDGADAGQMRRMADGGEHLRGSDIGAAEHADFAVGVGEGGGPLDGVVAVVGFVLEGVPLALGGVAAAHVLHHDHEAAPRRRDGEIGAVVLVVGRALQEDRILAVAGGAGRCRRGA